MIRLTVVICTYNRVDILYDCVRSILASIGDLHADHCEVIIVNNHPDNHQDLLNRLSSFKSLKIMLEANPGLSIARNAGIAAAQGSWLGFVDDDAIVPDHFIQVALSNIESDDFDCFGGRISSWWKYPRPRWLPETYGSKPVLRDHRDILNEEEYNWGSNIFIRKSALQAIDGFPESIGMKGKKIGYAAENIVQDKLRGTGHTIGYDPDLSIDHLVLPAKLQLSWHIRAAYATARDGRQVFPDDYTITGYFKTMKRILAAPVKGLFTLTQKEYYWENWVLDSVTPCAQLVGKFRALF